MVYGPTGGYVYYNPAQVQAHAQFRAPAPNPVYASSGITGSIPSPAPQQAYAPPQQTYAAPQQTYAAAEAYQPAAQTFAYAQPVPGEQPYTLDAGDRVRITVFGQDGLNASYSVDPSGMITLPLAGIVPARGLTKDQLAAAITQKLKAGYIREPHVAVEIETYRPFFILGEVTAPGQYPFVANMTVETAVAIAGGFTPRADHHKITVSRNISGTPYRGMLPPNASVRPGDTISVEERWF
jgi:polysaccharide export outer membrane protein